VNYPIYRTTQIPDGLSVSRASADKSEGVEQYILSKDATLVVHIEETTSSAVTGKEQKIPVGSFTGYYWEADGQYHLRVDMGTTQVAFTGWASEISKDDLMKLAASLQKVG